MKIQFKIHYKTQWGQSLDLLLHTGDNSVEKYEMHYNEKSEWSVEIEIEPVGMISYQYAVQYVDKTLSFEYGGIRTFHFPVSTENISVIDNWRASYGESPFVSTAFADCFFKRTIHDLKPASLTNNLILRLNCPQMEPERHFAVIGNQDSLGNWDVKKKVRLDESQFPIWSTSLDAAKIKFPLEYKYLIVDTKTDEVLAWGGGPNRLVDKADKLAFTIVTEEHFIRTIPSWRATGVAIPVFSLRSEEGFGIGEFNDLNKMVDWAKKTGQRIIQILPINDTILYHTNYDSYPYNAVSVYALHPIYLHLESVGKLKTKKLKDYFLAKKKELNGKNFSDYQNVLMAKWEFFKIIYPQESPKVFASDDYKLFFETNREWLVPYAAFSYLRDLNGSPEFSKWGNFKTYDKQQIEELSAPGTSYYDEIALYYFLQYHLHKQLIGVHDYARENGVAF